MTKLQPDFSFVRGGRALGAWLRELVAEDASTRLAAGEALRAMMWGLPTAHTRLAEVDWGSATPMSDQRERFNAAVRAAVDAPGFDAAGFVRELILYRMITSEDFMRRFEKRHELDSDADPFEERLLKRLEASTGDNELIEVGRRYLRWLCASMARGLKTGNAAFEGAEAHTFPGVMAVTVFHALDTALLVDRPGLHAMLDGNLRREAIRALVRIGPPAADFAPVLFKELDAQEHMYSFEGAQALGSIGRDDPDVIDGLLRRLHSGKLVVRAGAAAALRHAGPPLAGRLEIALDLLFGATRTPGLVCEAVLALASVGRDRETVLNRVLELAEPRPPRWHRDENYPEAEYDEVMAERGAAIDALSYFKQFSGRVVSALIAAFDTFEEADPDWGYDGEHGRICHALEAFGPDAAPAVPRLVRFLEEWLKQPDEDFDRPKGVFGLLTTIGPAAAAAMPVLMRFRETRRGGLEPPPAMLDPADRLDRAILALQGPTETAP